MKYKNKIHWLTSRQKLRMYITHSAGDGKLTGIFQTQQLLDWKRLQHANWKGENLAVTTGVGGYHPCLLGGVGLTASQSSLLLLGSCAGRTQRARKFPPRGIPCCRWWHEMCCSLRLGHHNAFLKRGRLLFFLPFRVVVFFFFFFFFGGGGGGSSCCFSLLFSFLFGYPIKTTATTTKILACQNYSGVEKGGGGGCLGEEGMFEGEFVTSIHQINSKIKCIII